MKHLLTILLLSAGIAHATDVSQLTVKRLSQDVYQTVPSYGSQKKIIVTTEYCSESAYTDTPVTLVYGQYNTYHNKLLFGNGRECRVKSVFVETR